MVDERFESWGLLLMDSINRDKEHEQVRIDRQQANSGGEGICVEREGRARSSGS